MDLDASWVPFVAGLSVGGLAALTVWWRQRRRMRLVRFEIDDLRTQTKNARDTRDAVGEVIGSMTQRVIGPLQSIAGYGRVLEQSQNLTDAQRAISEAVCNSARQLEETLSDALRVSLSTTGSLTVEETEIDVRDLMGQVARSVRSRCIRKQLQFSLLLGPDLPATVMTDAVKLRYVLQAMVNEVIDDTDIGGVTLSAARHLTPTPGNTEVRLTFEACGGVSVPSVEPGSPKVRLGKQSSTSGGGQDHEPTLAEQFIGVLGGDVVSIEGAGGDLTIHAEVVVQTTEAQPAEVIALDEYQPIVAEPTDAGFFFGAPATEEERLVDMVLRSSGESS